MVLGQCGAWLAAQNPDWTYALNTPTMNRSGDGYARGAGGLAETTARTRSAARAGRAEFYVEEDAPDERAAFIATLSIGLSLTDEPFLEAALDDRRKEVRQIAAQWLTQLPPSRLCQRMIDSTIGLLSIKKQLLKTQLEVVLPEACDKAMVRDGLEVKPPRGVGEKAWWLQQLLAATPLSTRTQRWPIATLIQAAAKSEWHTPIIGLGDGGRTSTRCGVERGADQRRGAGG